MVGISFKSAPKTARWAAIEEPQMKLCSADEDFRNVEALATGLGWPPLELAAHRGHIYVWRAAGTPLPVAHDTVP